MKITKIALALTALLMLGACSDADTARRALTEQGYTDIVTTGYSMFACSDSDTFQTGFRATSPAGVPVTGVVCSGWLKGSTIRTF